MIPCGVKFFLLLCAVAALATGCTTLANRRDLYNPSEDAGPYHSLPPAHPNQPGANNPSQAAPPPTPQ